jgi:hypothetical protein
VDNSILSQELEPLNAQIDKLQLAVVTLEGELRGLEDEIDSFAIAQQNFDILRDATRALDSLQELGAGELFWDGLPEDADISGHSERLWTRIADFDERTRDLKLNRAEIEKKIGQQMAELDGLFEEVQQAKAREERRQDEFLVVREMSPLAYRPMLMPWAMDAESEKRFRKTLLIAMTWSLVLGVVIPQISLPLPDRSRTVYEVPERIAMLVRQAPPVPPPVVVPEKPKEEEKPEPEKKKPEAEKKKAAKPEEKVKPKEAPEKIKPTVSEPKVAKKKVTNLGVLAFKSNFSDLMDEVPVAKLGSDARLKKLGKKIPGQARAQRSLVTSQATGGSSGGIANYEVSRNLGTGGKEGGSGYGNAGEIGEVGTEKVESTLAGLTEETGRPLSDGLGAARTDEEIQIVFDRYKATLYRIYNKELRKDPTLRGKLLLRLTIEPGGEVSMCIAESTDLASPELVGMIVDRVKRFNFGQKDDVPKITILYPIDFLPAG